MFWGLVILYYNGSKGAVLGAGRHVTSSDLIGTSTVNRRASIVNKADRLYLCVTLKPFRSKLRCSDRWYGALDVRIDILIAGAWLVFVLCCVVPLDEKLKFTLSLSTQVYQ